MAVKVLVVDDSGFFRRRVSEILSADGQIQVVGTATNGREAIEQALALRPDVITMDYEMPLMDGITAVRNIMQRCPTPVLMFSSLTHEGARVTLDVLSVGTQRIGFVVDQLVGQEEVVIKPLGKMLQGTPGMAGATITGDGRIALILDVPSMLKRYARRI